MKYIITETQKKNLADIIQKLINVELENIKKESEEWGLGEMDELDEIDSVDEIRVEHVVAFNGISVYVNFYVNSDRDDFQNIRAEIQYKINIIIPNLKIFINDIIRDNLKFS